MSRSSWSASRLAAFLFAAVAVRQFSQEERSRARSELSRQSLEHGELIEEFAEQAPGRRGRRARRLRDAPRRDHAAHVYFVGRSGLQPPIDEVRFGKAPKGTEARLNWKLLGRTGEDAARRRST